MVIRPTENEGRRAFQFKAFRQLHIVGDDLLRAPVNITVETGLVRLT